MRTDALEGPDSACSELAGLAAAAVRGAPLRIPQWRRQPNPPTLRGVVSSLQGTCPDGAECHILALGSGVPTPYDASAGICLPAGQKRLENEICFSYPLRYPGADRNATSTTSSPGDPLCGKGLSCIYDGQWRLGFCRKNGDDNGVCRTF
eukprot:SM003257S12636  [mRNA]  locus=s3257:495:1471:+ [translate_table: standard]